MQNQLSTADVENLMANPVAEIRARTAAKVADHFANDALSAEERELAYEILRVLAEDVSQEVRKALAEGLCRSEHLPRDLALKLAADVEAVSLPILEMSTVFTEQDLIELVRAGTAPEQLAIACRAVVPADVADALIETHNNTAVQALVCNRGARLNEAALGQILKHYGDDDEIKGAMVHRESLPLTITERLVSMVSDKLRERLLMYHELPLKVACDLTLESRERALAALVDQNAGAADPRPLVAQLYGHGRLTPGLVIRILCSGDLSFFEEALRLMAVVSRENAQILIHDEGPLGLKSICERAGFTPSFIEVVRIAFSLFRDGHDGDTPEARGAFRRELLERINTRFAELGAHDVEDLLDHLNRLAEPVH